MPTIYYSLVAYGQTVLVDFTQCSGNFQQITLDIIKHLDTSNNTRMSYTSAEYMFHIVIDDGIIYLCMADDSMGKSAPYAYLYEIKKRFTSGSLKERAPYCNAYELRRDFESVLGQQMKRFNKGDYVDPNSGRVDALRQDVNEVKSIMTQNIDKVLERSEKLNILVDKTESLERSSASFMQHSRKLQRKFWWKNKKICIILVLLLLVIVAVVTVVILIEEDVIK